MKSVDLGTCCGDCFNALNFTPQEVAPENREALVRCGKALSVLADKERVKSLHTGEAQGFSWGACCSCGSTLGGDRWELHGLAENPY